MSKKIPQSSPAPSPVEPAAHPYKPVYSPSPFMERGGADRPGEWSGGGAR